MGSRGPSAKVSVLVVTHDHAPFIDRALRSVFEQETDFAFEVLISEDASTDGTREIVRSWSDRYPDRVRLLLSRRNLRSNRVVSRGFSAARGEYVALLDGDDYWTSPSKLRRQVAEMDGDRSLSLCFHNAEIVGASPGTGRRTWTPFERKRRLALEDLWSGNPFATCSAMFRRSSVPEIPDWYDGFFPVTDWPLYVLFAERGDIAFLPEVMGAYRLHPGGSYSSRSDGAKLATMDELYRRINECLDRRYDRRIRSGHWRYFVDWAGVHLAGGRLGLAARCLEFARAYGAPPRGWERLRPAALGVQLWWARARGGR